MISRKSLTAVAATTLVLSLGSASASFAATSTPAPKKPSISGGTAGAESTAGHEAKEGAKVQADLAAAISAYKTDKAAAKAKFQAAIAALGAKPTK